MDISVEGDQWIKNFLETEKDWEKTACVFSVEHVIFIASCVQLLLTFSDKDLRPILNYDIQIANKQL